MHLWSRGKQQLVVVNRFFGENTIKKATLVTGIQHVLGLSFG